MLETKEFSRGTVLATYRCCSLLKVDERIGILTQTITMDSAIVQRPPNQFA